LQEISTTFGFEPKLMMNNTLMMMPDYMAISLFVILILLLAGITILLVMAVRFMKMLHYRRSGKGLMDNNETQKWSADIRTKLIECIEHGSYENMTYLDELEELTNFDGAVPALSVIEVNIVELIMSYRREILHETKSGTSVNIQTAMSPQSRASLDTVVFRQLMMNLLRICAKRTEQGRIVIEYEWENEGLRFKIEDSGNALPAKAYPALFTENLSEDMIVNLDKNITMTKLKICKIIVDGWLGSIKALPGANDMGLVFEFWIPCKIRVN